MFCTYIHTLDRMHIGATWRTGLIDLCDGDAACRYRCCGNLFAVPAGALAAKPVYTYFVHNPICRRETQYGSGVPAVYLRADGSGTARTMANIGGTAARGPCKTGFNFMLDAPPRSVSDDCRPAGCRRYDRPSRDRRAPAVHYDPEHPAVRQVTPLPVRPPRIREECMP